MNFLDTLDKDIVSEFELLDFLKGEVKTLTKRNDQLERMCQRAYTTGYADCHRGKKYDNNFGIKDLDGGI